MKYEAKCIIISRKKRPVKTDDLGRPCGIALFNINDAHKTNEVPKKILDFENVEKVVIQELKVGFFLAGADVIINRLKSLDITREGPNIIITGKQE
ncbi:MAG: hypothetical protein PHG05_04075 [Candidatus Nanoarchaeia archaeon]|nr:hypothetical protein [Candidatus Nanoarchaeia archaeon]